MVASNNNSNVATGVNLRVGVLLHVYYLEVLPSLLRVLPHFPENLVVLVSTTPQYLEQVKSNISACVPNAHLSIKAVPNSGFDIAPMLICFAEELSKLDIVCKLHTKNSLHYVDNAGWREHLIHNLAGSPEIVTSIQHRFAVNNKLGLVFASAFPNLRKPMRWSRGHLNVGRELLQQLDLRATTFPDFPAGSMFWIRPKAITSLLDRQWAWSDFESDQGEDLSHVVERLILPVVNANGFTWDKVSNIGHPVIINQPADRVLGGQLVNQRVKARIALVLHIWAIGGLQKAVRAIKNIPEDFDLYVTVSSAVTDEVSEVFLQHFESSRCNIIEVPNVGHDVAPFLDLGKQLLAYELVCKIHLKQSSAEWFDYLLENLLGGVTEVKVILAMFDRDHKLGLVYPQVFPPVRKNLQWGSNYAVAARIAEQIGFPMLKSKSLKFISSTMFWCRPACLAQLFEFDDFRYNKDDNDKRDGGVSHAVERLILPLAIHNGYKTRTVLFHAYDGDPALEVYAEEEV